MRFAKENTGYFVLFIFIGALLCAALGVFLAELIPSLSIIKKSLISGGFDIGFLEIRLRISLMSIIGAVAGAVIFAKA